METYVQLSISRQSAFYSVKNEVICLASVMFPQHYEDIANQLVSAFKALKRDMQCWIPMLQHNLLDDDDIHSLITEKKYHYYFNRSNCSSIDPTSVEKFADEVCELIYAAILISYQIGPTSRSLLSRLYSFCIGKTSWDSAHNKSRLAIV